MFRNRSRNSNHESTSIVLCCKNKRGSLNKLSSKPVWEITLYLLLQLNQAETNLILESKDLLLKLSNLFAKLGLRLRNSKFKLNSVELRI